MTNIVLLGTRSLGREIAQVLDVKANLVGVFSPEGFKDATTDWATRHGVWMGPRPHPGAIPLHVDLIVAAHWTGFIAASLRERPRYGTIVGHPSLLPRHRGIAAVEHTVQARDAIAGYTWFRPVDELDAGPVVHQEFCHVDPEWDASALWREALFPLAVSTVWDAVSAATSGRQTEQDPRFATLAHRAMVE